MDDELYGLHSRDRASRRWSEADLRTLRRLAGTVPVDQIAATLQRSPDAVRRTARRLGVDLWCPPGGLVRCPVCGEWRTYLRYGVCPICRRRATVERLKERERELESKVGREFLERSRSLMAAPVRRVPRPRASDGYRGIVEYEQALREQLSREKHRIRKRCERMEEWIRRHSPPAGM